MTGKLINESKLQMAQRSPDSINQDVDYSRMVNGIELVENPLAVERITGSRRKVNYRMNSHPEFKVESCVIEV